MIAPDDAGLGMISDLNSAIHKLVRDFHCKTGLYITYVQILSGSTSITTSWSAKNEVFVLPFNHSGQLVTGVALANPTVLAVSITVTIRNQRGEIVDKRLLSLRKHEHQAFVLPTTWNSIVGIRRIIEFQATGFGVGALGIRANGNAFRNSSGQSYPGSERGNPRV
jgi:hypothetical protein